MSNKYIMSDIYALVCNDMVEDTLWYIGIKDTLWYIGV